MALNSNENQKKDEANLKSLSLKKVLLQWMYVHHYYHKTIRFKKIYRVGKSERDGT